MTEQKHEPRTDKGTQTRRRLLEAAEQVFAERGYHDASIVKIAEAAGVASGTFYIYFKTKQEIFDECHRPQPPGAAGDGRGSSRGTTRSEAERLGFEAFFRFTGEHPALYRIIRQAEFVSPHTLRLHYERIVEGYVEGLTRARTAGEVADLDPDVVAWALMGAGELIGMRCVLWDDQRRSRTTSWRRPCASSAARSGRRSTSRRRAPPHDQPHAEPGHRTRLAGPTGRRALVTGGASGIGRAVAGGWPPPVRTSSSWTSTGRRDAGRLGGRGRAWSPTSPTGVAGRAAGRGVPPTSWSTTPACSTSRRRGLPPERFASPG